MNTFKYRFRSPLGGLAADLTAALVVPSGSGESSQEFFLQVHGKVGLIPPRAINWRDLAWLSFGLAAHAPDLASRHPEGLLIKVDSFTFPLAHFRSEVAALAMDGWLRQEFGFPDRGLCVTYDEGIGNYRFQWGEYASPFSDDLLK